MRLEKKPGPVLLKNPAGRLILQVLSQGFQAKQVFEDRPLTKNVLFGVSRSILNSTVKYATQLLEGQISRV
jgi:hypothetical protein